MELSLTIGTDIYDGRPLRLLQSVFRKAGSAQVCLAKAAPIPRPVTRLGFVRPRQTPGQSHSQRAERWPTFWPVHCIPHRCVFDRGQLRVARRQPIVNWFSISEPCLSYRFGSISPCTVNKHSDWTRRACTGGLLCRLPRGMGSMDWQG